MVRLEFENAFLLKTAALVTMFTCKLTLTGLNCISKYWYFETPHDLCGLWHSVAFRCERLVPLSDIYSFDFCYISIPCRPNCRSADTTSWITVRTFRLKWFNRLPWRFVGTVHVNDDLQKYRYSHAAQNFFLLRGKKRKHLRLFQVLENQSRLKVWRLSTVNLAGDLGIQNPAGGTRRRDLGTLFVPLHSAPAFLLIV